MIRFTIFLLIFIYYLSGGSLFAQRTLTLEESIRLAQENSPTAEIAKSVYSSKSYNYKSFRSLYLPNLSLTGSLPGLDRSINQNLLDDGTEVFIEQSNLYSSADLLLNQRIPWTGGNLSISSGLSRIDILEPVKRYYWRTTPLSISLEQPIFQFNSMKWDIEEQELDYKAASKEFIVDMEALAMDVAAAFFDVYIQKMNVENAELNVSINDTLYTISKGRYQVGKIAENDLLQNELALSNSRIELDNSRLDYRRAKEELAILIGIDPDDELEIITPENIPEFEVVAQKAVEYARENNPQMLGYELDKLRAGRDLASAKSSNDFDATLRASFGYNQSAGQFNDAYQELLDQERLNLTFSMPIFQWGRGSAQVEAAQAEKERTFASVELQKRNFEQDVKYQALRFRQLQRQVAVSAKADTIARRRFDVAKNRYLIGKIDLNTFFIAQNEKDAALRSYIQTLKSYWVSYFNLRRLTLYDFIRKEKIAREIEP